MSDVTTLRRQCVIYRSPRREGLYLYVDAQEGLERVPEPLLQRFGPPREAMRLLLHPGRKLARAEIGQVLAALEEPGYYLQLPPREHGGDDVLPPERPRLEGPLEGPRDD